MPNYKTIDPQNPDSHRASRRAVFTDAQNLVMGMMDKIPEAFRPQVAALKEKIDAQLVRLADEPTPQIPAAQEASWALNSLGRALEQMQEMFSGAMDTVNRIISEFTPKAEQLNALELARQKGDLISKEDAEKTRAQAVADALTQERAHAKMLSTRRSLLCAADLPAPTADEIMEGDEPKFTALKEQSTERLKLIREAGLHHQLNAAELAQLIYGTQGQYDLALKAARGAKTPAPAPDPMAGGGRQASAPTGKLRF